MKYTYKKLTGCYFNLYFASASGIFNKLDFFLVKSVHHIFSLLLKLFTDSALTTVSGRLFQTYHSPVEKRKFTEIIFHTNLMYFLYSCSCSSWNNVEFYDHLTALLVCDKFVHFYHITSQSSIF